MKEPQKKGGVSKRKRSNHLEGGLRNRKWNQKPTFHSFYSINKGKIEETSW